MNPMEPGPEDFARTLNDQRRRMREAQAIVYYAHSRTGLLARFLQRLADTVDPSGVARRDMR